MTGPVNETQFPVVRPWYREPWPWVLIAIPLLTIIACAFTLWLAISYPDHLVLDEQEYGAGQAAQKRHDESHDKSHADE